MSSCRRLSFILAFATAAITGVAAIPAHATPGGHGNQAAIARLLAGRQQIIDQCALNVFKHQLLYEQALEEVARLDRLIDSLPDGAPYLRVVFALRTSVLLRANLHLAAIEALQASRDRAVNAINDAIRRLGGSPPV
jgi:hypothetical protein